MKFIDYILDTIYVIFLNLLFLILSTVLLILFNVNKYVIILIMFTYLITFIIGYLITYFRKQHFYNLFTKKLDKLDKKYFITELITYADILEGKILLDYLYDIDKSYIEEINTYKRSNSEFKEYIELWCHEIKTPLSTSKLIIENNKNKVTNNILEELNQMENYIEQVLYYAKSDLVYHDYIIKKTNLKDCIDNVIKRNKKDIISKHIKIDNKVDNINVESDNLWLQFIINQIVVNSIKYSKDKDSYIKFDVKDNENNVILEIIDNGIGINNVDLKKVFHKGFTGKNGRKNYSSTGIGLYLCKKLCDKLSHEIIINSKENEYTKVIIIIPKNSMIV